MKSPDPKRDPTTLCVVSARDVMAIEQSGSFQYHYSLWHLSPIDGIGRILGPRHRVSGQRDQRVIGPIPLWRVKPRRITSASVPAPPSRPRGLPGVPLGGELEYTDANTLAHAPAAAVVRE